MCDMLLALTTALIILLTIILLFTINYNRNMSATSSQPFKGLISKTFLSLEIFERVMKRIDEYRKLDNSIVEYFYQINKAFETYNNVTPKQV